MFQLGLIKKKTHPTYNGFFYNRLQTWHCWHHYVMLRTNLTKRQMTNRTRSKKANKSPFWTGSRMHLQTDFQILPICVRACGWSVCCGFFDKRQRKCVCRFPFRSLFNTKKKILFSVLFDIWFVVRRNVQICAKHNIKVCKWTVLISQNGVHYSEYVLDHKKKDLCFF